MALKSAMRRINDARKKYESELKKLGKSAAKEFAAELGPLIPEGFFLEWTQGTPSYNDGEPCTFSVYDPKLVTERAAVWRDSEDHEVEGPGYGEEPPPGVRLCFDGDEREYPPAEEDEGSYDLEYMTREDVARHPGLTLKAVRELHSAWREVCSEDMLRKIFGDGAAVRITGKGKCQREDWDCGY